MRLKELRTAKNFYQKDLAEMLGVDRTTYSKYESGSSEPNHETLLKLAEIFEVSTDYLLGRDEKENKPASVSTDGQSEEMKELIRLYDQASPEMQAAALGMLRAAEAARTAPDVGKEGK